MRSAVFGFDGSLVFGEDRINLEGGCRLVGWLPNKVPPNDYIFSQTRLLPVTCLRVVWCVVSFGICVGIDVHGWMGGMGG